MIETLDDIMEQLADALDIYGACGHGERPDHHCRPCWVASMTGRIRDAVEVERKLSL